MTAEEDGNVLGSWSSVRSPLDLEMTRTRPRVMAYATQWVAPIVVPGKKIASCLTSAMAVDLTASRGAWTSSRGLDTSKTMLWACGLES